MRILMNVPGTKSINLDNIDHIAISPIRTGEGILDNEFVLSINNFGFYRGDEADVKIRYINLLDILSHMDDHSSLFVSSSSIVQMKEDGTFIVSEFDLWEPNIDTKKYQ